MKYSLLDFKNIVSQNLKEDGIKIASIDVDDLDDLDDLDDINNINDIDDSDDSGDTIEELNPIQENNLNDYTNKWYINKKEINLMQQLYSQINNYLCDFVIEVINEYDYKDSPLYSESGISREMLAQMIDRVIEMAYQDIEQVEEIKLQRDDEPLLVGKYWSSWDMLRANIQSLLLSQIFVNKRPIIYN